MKGGYRDVPVTSAELDYRSRSNADKSQALRVGARTGAGAATDRTGPDRTGPVGAELG